MKKRIVDPLLPEPYCFMTAAELDAEVAQYDKPFSLGNAKPLTPAQREQHRRAGESPSGAAAGGAGSQEGAGHD